MNASHVKIALCQMSIDLDPDQNIKYALQQIENMAKQGAEIVVLPEIFICPYNVSKFKEIAIDDKDNYLTKFQQISEKYNILLVAGSVVEKEDDNLYNTSYLFDRGKRLGKYRKNHLFNVDIKNGISFRESDAFKEGESILVFETSFGKIGVAICFDLRFPEMIKKMALRGAKLIIAPAAFNTVTGPMHWELVLRARAMDSQSFLLACSPPLNQSYSYKAYGHSAVVDPYGKVVQMLDEKEGSILCSIDLALVDKARHEIPLLKSTKFLSP